MSDPAHRRAEALPGGGKLELVRCVVSLLAALSLGAASCAPSSTSATDRASSPSPSFRVATAIIDKGERTVLVRVEVAETDAERRTGLMGRRSLAPDAGMVFIFFAPTNGGFWMKNTHIPLSIAFFDRSGKILRILDMDPCRRDPCPVYEPGVSYWGALEVNRGAFDRWGVRPGHVIRLAQ